MEGGIDKAAHRQTQKQATEMTLYPQLSINLSPTPKSAKDIPQRTLSMMGAKLYLLGALTWDYADTVCNIAAQMRIGKTKPLCRAVRELKREYDRFRNRSMRDEALANETELALLFEDICQQHFTKLNYGIAADKSMAGLTKEYEMLIRAVQMAMTVIDTMKLYAAQCDEWIRSQGVEAHSILSDHYLSLAILLPEFAGDSYNANAEARKLTARILLKEINQIEIYDEKGKI